jgi:hypothetical protein
VERGLSHNLHKFTVPIFHCFLFSLYPPQIEIENLGNITSTYLREAEKPKIRTKIELVDGVTAGKAALEIFRREGEQNRAEKIVRNRKTDMHLYDRLYRQGFLIYSQYISRTKT